VKGGVDPNLSKRQLRLCELSLERIHLFIIYKSGDTRHVGRRTRKDANGKAVELLFEYEP